MDRVPIELWNEIFTYLNLSDLRHIRLVCRYFNTITTPACFATLEFDLRRNINGIINIASGSLAPYVQVMVLRTIPLLRDFHRFDIWERAIALPGDPDVGSNEVADCDENCLMSYKEWSGLSEDQKVVLYEEYEADRMKELNHVHNLTKHLYFRKFGCIGRERVHVESTLSTADERLDETSALERFDEAVKKFSNLAVLKHEPGFMMNFELSSQWRQLRFNLGVLITETYHKDDEDVEALQLSIILRAIGWAERKLRSMDLYVGGPAFWGPDRLRRLWQGEGHADIRMLRKTHGNAVEADRESRLAYTKLSDGRDRYSKQLAIMEYALISLTHLDLSVSEEDDDGGLLAATGPLFEFLCCCEKLEQARLVFGRCVDGSLPTGYGLNSLEDHSSELLGLLTRQTPWLNLRELELEVATDENSLLGFLTSLAPTLRHLALSNVTLLPSHGQWERTILRIADVMQLESLKLSNLCDYPQLQGQPRRQKRSMFEENEKVFDRGQLRSLQDSY